MDEEIARPHWRQLVARLGGPPGVVGVLLCTALPVVPFGLAVSSALGRTWGVLATRPADVGCVLVAWVLALLWVGRALRA
jgi:hypothetical protein